LIHAIDSETFEGRAILLTRPDSWTEPKNFHECMDYFSLHKENAAYNMDYDVQACLTYLPFKVRERLAWLNDATFYVDDTEYRVRYIRHKFCRVWRSARPLFICYDMAQFYNCSLNMAAKKLGIEQKDSIPVVWYRNMKARLEDPKTREAVLNYGMKDARILQEIIDKTVDAFQVAGMKFERPFSNASFSQRVFMTALTRRGVSRDVDKLAHKAYFGGRIECLRMGHFKKAYYYDIHSAYPSIIASLVATDGKWIRHEKYVRDDAVYAFVDCTLSIPVTVKVSPLAVRLQSNRIVYPSGTFRRVLTMAEFLYCERRGYVAKVHKVIQHIWPKWRYPFGKVRDLYLQRQLNPSQSYAIKIVLNAVYGKTAQMLNERLPTTIANSKTQWIEGQAFKQKKTSKRFTNFVYASEITSRIRMKLLEDIPSEDVISYATDGVFTVKPVVGLDIGDNLGQWSKSEEVTDLYVIGSGVYQYTDSEGKVVTKFRGFNPRDFNLVDLLKKAKERKTIPIRVVRNTSLRQSVEKPHDLNILKTVKRDMNLNFDTKRYWPVRRTARDLLTKQFESEALVYYGSLKLQRSE
jgi:hypothetical protein